jgi:peptide deformylase
MPANTHIRITKSQQRKMQPVDHSKLIIYRNGSQNTNLQQYILVPELLEQINLRQWAREGCLSVEENHLNKYQSRALQEVVAYSLSQ